jgi:hypothetical protein
MDLPQTVRITYLCVPGRFLDIAPLAGRPFQLVEPHGGADLGSTGRIGVAAWSLLPDTGAPAGPPVPALVPQHRRRPVARCRDRLGEGAGSRSKVYVSPSILGSLTGSAPGLVRRTTGFTTEPFGHVFTGKDKKDLAPPDGRA